MEQEDLDHQINTEEAISIPTALSPKLITDIKDKASSASICIQKSYKKASSKKSLSFMQKYYDMAIQVSQMNSTVSNSFLDSSYSNMKTTNQEYKIVEVKGATIEGTWKSNRPHGDIIIKYDSGDYFKGRYENGEKVYGKVKFKDGFEYLGGFSRDLFYGHGILTDPSKRIITAQWNEGKIVGNAMIQYPKGQVYIGQIKNFKKHGFGKISLLSGGYYEGYFQNGTIQGYGKYFQNNVLVAEGVWKDAILCDNSDLTKTLIKKIKQQCHDKYFQIKTS